MFLLLSLRNGYHSIEAYIKAGVIGKFLRTLLSVLSRAFVIKSSRL